MFDSELFDKWLNDAAAVAIKKVGSEEGLSQQDVMVMILKLQTNHITHMETTIHAELLELRKETNTRFEEVHRRFEEAREETNTRFEEARKETNMRFKEMHAENSARFKEARQEAKEASQETNKRFEEARQEADKRSEKARQEAKEARQEADKRSEKASQEADKRSEKASQEANTRFEQARQETNKRFEDMHRKSTFMQWLIIVGFSTLGIMIALLTLFFWLLGANRKSTFMQWLIIVGFSILGLAIALGPSIFWFDWHKEITFSTEPPQRTDGAAESADQKHVYLISHPNYPGEYKVGIATNAKQRLNAYQTSDPNRAYKLEHSLLTGHYRALERHIHERFENKHEWVRAKKEDIIAAMGEYTPH